MKQWLCIFFLKTYLTGFLIVSHQLWESEVINVNQTEYYIILQPLVTPILCFAKWYWPYFFYTKMVSKDQLLT